MRKQLRTFSRRRKCPKCGGLDVSTKYREKEDYRSIWECKQSVTIEHMCRQCRYCDFTWDEAPLDRKPHA